MPKNLILGLIYAHLSRGTIFFYKTSSQILFQAIILCNLKENQSTKLQKMGKNLTSGPIDPTPPPPPPKKNFFVGFTSTRCQILSQAIIACNFQENEKSKLSKMVGNLIFYFISKTGFISQQISCSVIIMYNIRKN